MMANINTLKSSLPVLGSQLRVLQEKAGTTRRIHGRQWQTICKRIKLRDRYACRVCGHTSASNEVDHIIALERGGSNDDSNLQTLCHECHAKKTTQEQRMRFGKRF